MNREIKFRFWSGTKMFYDAGNVIECLKQQIYHNEGYKLGYDHVGLHNSLFLQYTGLKDKNGVDVFECDIVKCKSIHSDKYSPIICRVDYITNEMRFDLMQFWVNKNQWLPLSNNPSDYILEVIGNIFENPELLNKS